MGSQRGTLIPGGTELSVPHTHLLSGTVHAGGRARSHGRGLTGSCHLAYVLNKQVPKRTEREDMEPFLNLLVILLKYNNIRRKNLDVVHY